MSLVFNQLKERAQQWQVTIQETQETPGSVLAFGVSRGSRVVLKVTKQHGDEWRSGEVLRAFDGHGTVRVLEFDAGAVLLERLDPGEPLVNLVRHGQDERATQILAELMGQMAYRAAPEHSPTLLDWSHGFDRYLKRGDEQVPHDLVAEARECYQRLVASQQTLMLLHGDLQHYNALFDTKRGWVAIDPKGVVGELEYEVGAILRNPVELSDLYTSLAAVERRLEILAGTLKLDHNRALCWAFAQGVLSAIWDVEDGYRPQSDNSALRLAHIIKRLVREIITL
ncbi:MAG: aminoglycoside phosphotransferase family protein [Pyrinomonadaceae bacterium]